MLTVLLVITVILTLLVPLIVLCAYGYVCEGAWRPATGGVLWLFAIQILLRLIMPVAGMNFAWFRALAENSLLYSVVFTILQALLTVLAFWLSARSQLKNERPQNYSVLFGYAFGSAQAVLFCGATALSALLSDTAVLSTLTEEALLLSLLECLSLVLIYMLLGSFFYVWTEKKQYGMIALASLALLGILLLGYTWTTSLGLPRAALTLILVLLAVLCIKPLKGQITEMFSVFRQKSTPETKPAA